MSDVLVSGEGEYCFELPDGSKAHEILCHPESIACSSIIAQAYQFYSMHGATRAYPINRPRNERLASIWDGWTAVQS